MASVLTVRVYRPDITADETELCERLQTLAELELDRLRDRTHGHERATIETALDDGITRVTAGSIDGQDLPLAAAALARGDARAITLVPAHTPCPPWPRTPGAGSVPGRHRTRAYRHQPGTHSVSGHRSRDDPAPAGGPRPGCAAAAPHTGPVGCGYCPAQRARAGCAAIRRRGSPPG